MRPAQGNVMPVPYAVAGCHWQRLREGRKLQMDCLCILPLGFLIRASEGITVPGSLADGVGVPFATMLLQSSTPGDESSIGLALLDQS
jgi:hypothetical protein